MLNGFILLSSIAGIILVVLLGLENFFFLFTGLGLVMGAIFVLLAKRSSRLLFFLFAVLLAALLFGVNWINFQANSFHVDFFNPCEYNAFLCLDHPSCPIQTDQMIPQMTALDLGLPQADQFNIELRRQPILMSQEFFLVDYQQDEQTITADWLWTGAEKFIPLEPWQYHIIVELNIDEVYFKQPTVTPRFDSDLKYLYLVEVETTENSTFEVQVNGHPLERVDTTGHMIAFAFTEPTRQINDICLVETGPSPPFSLHYLEPGFASIYVLESDPQPIIVEDLHLTRYFGFLNRFFPFYQWNADLLLAEFTVEDGQAYVENGLLYIQPTGLRPSLQFNHAPAEIAARGLAQFRPVRLWLNIGISTALLLTFACVSLLSDRYFPAWQASYLQIKNRLTNLKARYSLDYELKRVTPFKILFFIFLFLSWALILTTTMIGLIRLIAIVVLAVASLIMTIHVLRDIELTSK